MKKPVLLFLILLTCARLSAQYFEVGALTGTSNYLGELSEHRFSTTGFHPAIGIFGRYNATKYLSLKSSLTKATISGSDANATSAELRERNLSFRSDLLEFSVTGEVNFTGYNVREKKTGVPYFFSGIAVTYFNPQAQMRGAWYDLQPLKTEGKKYARTTVAIPFGLGVKFNLTYKLNFGIEAGARKTFTDYLDDVSTNYPDVLELRQSAPTTAALTYRAPEITGEFGENPSGAQRGDAGNSDWYFFAGLTVSVNLTDKYGLDFDPQYAEFKEHLKKPKKEKKVSKRKKKTRFQQKLQLLKKKNELQPQVKRRSKG